MLNQLNTPKVSTLVFFVSLVAILNGYASIAFASTSNPAMTYYSDGFGQGTIVSIQPISSSEDWKGGTIAATLLGAGIGGGLGALIGNGVGQVVAIITGAFLGGTAGGAAIAATSTPQDTVEYTIHLRNQQIIKVMQTKDPALVIGQKVLVVQNPQGRASVIIDNTGYIQQPAVAYPLKKVKPLKKR